MGEGDAGDKTAKDTVKLISAEGFEFLVDYKAACVSATVKNMLTSQGVLMMSNHVRWVLQVSRWYAFACGTPGVLT